MESVNGGKSREKDKERNETNPFLCDAEDISSVRRRIETLESQLARERENFRRIKDCLTAARAIRGYAFLLPEDVTWIEVEIAELGGEKLACLRKMESLMQNITLSNDLLPADQRLYNARGERVFSFRVLDVDYAAG